MYDIVERFFNWQSDMDWIWGPLLYLRPAKTKRMTLRMWFQMICWTLLFIAPLEAAGIGIWVYYDYVAAKNHEVRITPVVATEHWMNQLAPMAVLNFGYCLLGVCVVNCVGQHWAWNRRAERLNREGSVPEPAVVAGPGVWPPPPRTMP